MSNGEWEDPGASAPETHHPSPITHHPLRIALIRQRYTAFGGAERFVARAMEALSGQGARLTVVTRAWPGDGDNGALICNPLYIGSVWRDWSFARSACEALQERHFDLVQSHERIPCCDVYRAGDGVHREWLRQRRRVLGPLGRLGILLNPYHHYTLAAEKRLFASPRLKAVICNSRMIAEEIQDYFGLPETKLHVVYSGVDTVGFHPDLKRHRQALRERYAIPPDAPLFLFVGSGFERKGLDALLHALAQLPPGAHLIIVGKDKKAARFQALATRLGLGQRAHFAGAQQEVKPFYGAADAFVLPTLYDPFPNAALEAMAAGLPIITSSKSGAAELVENGRNGYVCDALDIGGLAEAMRQLLAPAHAAALGAASRTIVEPYNLEAMGSRLVGLYRSLVETG
ncbi:MAG: glycosyltransferase family 4 protein [Sulfuricella sp.]|nr:glycosyltransferase family 4 protein [Sulfuricella sp.]